jgi:cytochrome oxidase Cu insertion factor (SCO1/SenC/PrrC family)
LVSIDPERDTPETLANYVGAFGDYITSLMVKFRSFLQGAVATCT